LLGRKVDDLKKLYWGNHQLAQTWCRARGILSDEGARKKGLKNVHETNPKKLWEILELHHPIETAHMRELCQTRESERLYYQGFAARNNLTIIDEFVRGVHSKDDSVSGVDSDDVDMEKNEIDYDVDMEKKVVIDNGVLPGPPSDNEDSESYGAASVTEVKLPDDVRTDDKSVDVAPANKTDGTAYESDDESDGTEREDAIRRIEEDREFRAKREKEIRKKSDERKKLVSDMNIVDDEASESDEIVDKHPLRDYILGLADAKELKKDQQREVLRVMQEIKKKRAERALEEEANEDEGEVEGLIATATEEYEASKLMGRENVRDFHDSRVEEDAELMFNEKFTMKGLVKRRAQRYVDDMVGGSAEDGVGHRRLLERQSAKDTAIDFDDDYTDEYSYESYDAEGEDRQQRREQRKEKRARREQKLLIGHTEEELRKWAERSLLSNLKSNKSRGNGSLNPKIEDDLPDAYIPLRFTNKDAVSAAEDLLHSGGETAIPPVVTRKRDPKGEDTSDSAEDDKF